MTQTLEKNIFVVRTKDQTLARSKEINGNSCLLNVFQNVQYKQLKLNDTKMFT